MRARRLEPHFVETFPAPLKAGVLYVSIEFTTCAHLCACGCGEEVITPLSPAQWSLSYNGRDVSLHPSIGNWSLRCQSHYFLDRGSIRWSYQFTKQQIAANRDRDRLELQGHIANSDGAIIDDDGDKVVAATAWTRIVNCIRRRLGLQRRGQPTDGDERRTHR